jgi:hypothetical protein
MLIAIGFPKEKCIKALKKTKMNTERAAELLLGG